MPKYNVHLEVYDKEIEADSEEEAVEIAYDIMEFESTVTKIGD